MPGSPHLTDALAAAMAGLAPSRPPGNDRASDPLEGSRAPASRRVVPGLRWRATVSWPTASWEAAEAQEPWDSPPRRRIGGR